MKNLPEPCKAVIEATLSIELLNVAEVWQWAVEGKSEKAIYNEIVERKYAWRHVASEQEKIVFAGMQNRIDSRLAFLRESEAKLAAVLESLED